MKTLRLTRRDLVDMYVFAKTKQEQDAIGRIAEKPLSDLDKVRTYITIVNNKLKVIIKGVVRY